MPKMKYVFFDIDNTIWDIHQIIPDSAILAIQRLRAAGHAAYINTGRARGNVIAPSLWNIGFDGIIAACGNHIESDGHIIYENLLTDEQIGRCLEVTRNNHMPLVFEGPDYHYLNPEDFDDDSYVDILWDMLGDRARHLDKIRPGVKLNKFSADISKDTDFELVQKLLPDFDFINHDNVVVEAVPKGTSKASGIRKLMELKNIDLEDTYAIGDSMNDLDMIKFVGHGIVMGNGTKALKDVAEYVTTPLSEDGILNALEHYGLI